MNEEEGGGEEDTVQGRLLCVKIRQKNSQVVTRTVQKSTKEQVQSKEL